ncbi:MAG: hypothetical protein HUU50_05210 [Candidatus Brocadiae bacterium]|nr:hypothetical protein [Candidatus Brocadiia bacterium]
MDVQNEPKAEILSKEKKIELAKYSLSHLSELVKFADHKALVLLGILGFLSGHLLTKLFALRKEEYSSAGIALCLLAVICCLAALGFAIKVVYPRLKYKSIQKSKGFVYWAEILANPTPESFRDNFFNITQDEVLENFSNELYHVANINKQKYQALQKSFIMAVMSAIFMILFFIVN